MKAVRINPTWAWMNTHLSELTEAQLLGLIDQELARPRAEQRPTTLARLHGRYNILRTKREAALLAKGKSI